MRAGSLLRVLRRAVPSTVSPATVDLYKCCWRNSNAPPLRRDGAGFEKDAFPRLLPSGEHPSHKPENSSKTNRFRRFCALVRSLR
jgi:hypothetical protein